MEPGRLRREEMFSWHSTRFRSAASLSEDRGVVISPEWREGDAFRGSGYLTSGTACNNPIVAHPLPQ